MTTPVDAGDGQWLGLADAAEALGVSQDTIRRRMKRNEILSKREQRPQGFRWLVLVDEDQRANVGTSADDEDDSTPTPAPAPAPAAEPGAEPEALRTAAAATNTDGAPILTVLSDRDELIRELRDQLAERDRVAQVREREAAELRAIIARQASALEQAARVQAIAATTAAPPAASAASESAAAVDDDAGVVRPVQQPTATTTAPPPDSEPGRLSWWRRLFGS